VTFDLDARGLSDVVRRAPNPAKVAVVDGPARLTYADLDREASRVATALIAAGAQPGDRVALRVVGSDFVLGYLGALRAGLVAVPVNPAYTSAETDYIVGDSGAKLTLTSQTLAELLADVPAQAADPGLDRAGEDLAVLLYTSGTSGRPKGAMLSVRALTANLAQLAAVEPALLSASDVLLIPVPLAHVFGLNAGLGMALHTGATAVLIDRFNPSDSLTVCAAEGVSAVLGVPLQYASWLAEPGFAAGFERVRMAISGAASLPAALLGAYAERGVVLHDGYGLTEAAPVVAVERSDTPVAGSVGRPLPGVEVELRDAAGEPIDVEDDGDPGRVFLRGANLFSGYWPDGAGGPEADGWFGTGDIALRDADGNLHVIGRTSDLVIVHGFNVYPAEVEAVLRAEAGVAEVAVVGETGERGETVRAYVVALPGVVLDPDALLAAAAKSLARFKLPRAVDIVTALPHTVTGKVMKWRLLDQTDAS
jgi:long-chain acyl-CoA synthetase